MNKFASDDFCGRVMAHAFVDELGKIKEAQKLQEKVKTAKLPSVFRRRLSKLPIPEVERWAGNIEADYPWRRLQAHLRGRKAGVEWRPYQNEWVESVGRGSRQKAKKRLLTAGREERGEARQLLERPPPLELL
jgi:hypothetical protein